ncbi:MAG: IclR family transcriptional regulator [Alphaproteobacteria bacterium]
MSGQQMSNDKYRAPALEKGLDIIELLARQSEGMSQGEMAEVLDRSQGEIYRMLSTLVRRGYVVRGSSGSYVLSLRMFSISHRHPPLGRLVETALPMMRALTLRAWQSCHLGMESNGDIVIVASAESPGNWGLALKTGSVVGLWNTGTGCVIAAFRGSEEVDALIGTHRRAVGEPELDRVAFDLHLERIRLLGYERMASATTVGVTNIAFPIFDPFGFVVAVLSCPHLERLDDLEVPAQEEIVEMYGSLAGALTELYGGRRPDMAGVASVASVADAANVADVANVAARLEEV